MLIDHFPMCASRGICAAQAHVIKHRIGHDPFNEGSPSSDYAGDAAATCGY